MPATRLSDEQWRRVYERVKAGEQLRSLDREFGLSDGTVSGMITRRFGYVPRSKAPAMTREQSDVLYARLLRGESVHAIATELGIDDTALYKLMRNRYRYKTGQVRRRTVWSPTIRLDHASDTDLAYLAGIIDGEGSIMKILRNRAHPVWAIKVNMTDRPIIEWLHTFGGTFCVRPSRDPGRLKEQYAWKMHRAIDVKTMLEALLPYLRVKRDKAMEALAEFEADPMLMEGRKRAEADRRRTSGPVWVYPYLGGTPVRAMDAHAGEVPAS